MDAVMLIVIAVGVVAAGAWCSYAAIGTAVDRKRARDDPEASTHVPRVELELGHVGPRRLCSRRRVVVRREAEAIAHLCLGRGIRRVRGECLANDEAYDLDLYPGWPFVRARWPVGRTRMTMHRRSDGATVAQAAQPSSWWGRVALRGGVEFTRDGVPYELRPMQGRHGGAQLRADGEAVGSFAPEPGSTRGAATVPTTLDEEGQLFLAAVAAVFDFALSEDASGPGRAVPAEAEGARRGVPMGVALGAGGGAGGGCGAGGGGGGGC